ncbi:Pectin lyase-like superfamily protein [Zea mays]|uniref:Pectin lyase-like superfamily protein n=1 Tax=Zea mays TaxID=4577 RepID=A0A1D6LRD8_MAIZE|nr:Pectin lyase-like superfamily protein [Zea mays]
MVIGLRFYAWITWSSPARETLTGRAHSCGARTPAPRSTRRPHQGVRGRRLRAHRLQDPLRECQDGGLDQPHLHRHDVLPQQVVYCQRRLQGHRQGRHLQEHHRHLLHPGGHQPALHCQDPMHRRHHGRRQRRV